MQKEQEEILYISFNQDQSFFSIATEKGFKIYKISPKQVELVVNRQTGAGIGFVEMIYKTNIFAIVGGGKIPKYPKNKLMIWDDAQLKIIAQTSCKSEVKGTKITPQRCIIILETKIFLFNLVDFSVLQILETCPNPKGLCTVSTTRQELLIAYPSKRIGEIDLYTESNLQKIGRIQCHKSTLCCLQLNPSGSKLATASQKGTIIRIFDTATQTCIQQLRRGSQNATIYCLAFDLKGRWVACTSDSGTIHIFDTKPSSQDHDQLSEMKNRKSKFSIFSKIASYFDSEWSFASFKHSEKKTTVSFIGTQNHLAIVSTNGNIIIVKFNNQKGGECSVVSQFNTFDTK